MLISESWKTPYYMYEIWHEFSYVINWDFKFHMRKLSPEFQMQNIENFTCHVRSSLSNSFCWYIRNFTAEAILFHIYYRKIDACFSNVKYTVFHIPWGNVSIEMFQSKKHKKSTIHVENLWLCFDMWNIDFHIPCIQICIQIFITVI